MAHPKRRFESSCGTNGPIRRDVHHVRSVILRNTDVFGPSRAVGRNNSGAVKEMTRALSDNAA